MRARFLFVLLVDFLVAQLIAWHIVDPQCMITE